MIKSGLSVKAHLRAKRWIGAALAFACMAPAAALAAQAPADIFMKDGKLFPDSLSLAKDGTVYIGTEAHGVYRALPGETEFSPWIQLEGPGPINVGGVMVHDGSLWICTSGKGDGATALRHLSLPDGKQIGLFQGPAGWGCNDMAITASGDIYVTDTQNKRVLKMAKGTTTLVPWASDPERFDFVNGLVTQGNAVFVNSTTNGGLYRIDIKPDGTSGAITQLTAPRPLGRPDTMRWLAPNKFLIAEIVSNQAATGPMGHATVATIKGDSVDYRILEGGLDAPSSITANGAYALVIEAKKQYHRDPGLIGKDPGPMRAHFVPLGDAAKP